MRTIIFSTSTALPIACILSHNALFPSLSCIQAFGNNCSSLGSLKTCSSSVLDPICNTRHVQVVPSPLFSLLESNLAMLLCV